MTDQMREQSAIWLGIDLGTQSVRVIAVSPVSTILGESSQRLTSQRHGVRHEQNPEEWWHAVTAACRAIVAGLPAGSIRGVAVDGTSGTILLVDRSGKPLTTGLMYDDTRAAEEAQRVNEVGADAWASSGYRMQPSWALPRLLWLLREYPDLLPVARLAHQADFINRRFVGREVPTDESNALKTGYDLVGETWPHEVLALLGVPEKIMPAVVRAGTPLGAVCKEAAGLTGIPAGTAVIAGMTDGCAAQIGAGALGVGSWNSVLGTTLVLKGVTQELMRDPTGVVYSHRSPDGGWLPGGASNTGAAALTKYFPGRDLDMLSVQASEREPASIVAYPLVSHGERFPFTASAAEGFLLGEPADEIDLYAALLQGVAFVERLCFDYLDLLGAPTHGDLSMTGGGTRSRYWCQLRANVLGRPVRIPENAGAALGMAVLASSVGRKVAEAAAQMVRIREVIDPQPDRMVLFRDPYIRLINTFEQRGWLPGDVAEHARKRAGQ